ncbi:hypothetical protein VOLCADRAFT_97433 [Volvox carteri f. nagariensis]|uniref:Uncharacterized protein n=1 Tax=Volvox carteri f. nagariensis TaxID=3068 RepID=D8UCR5_VOLCA|nr:uncharacterized protein VOLCADRAFT_97433 [Volvox carteri f. nagariensis]EFJ42539.1 hypothetical protein VOLCADRAFT_97433 [Volvox carteri f. nagariensis]|eukprot:XP_002956395.1 hypothetical protein VOLCADRAFT_97433 [Volvox carteri f. nagariensis]
MQLSLIDPEAFKDGFSLGAFLSGIANGVLDPKAQPAGPKPDSSTAAAAARVSLDKARALLEVFEKAESEAFYTHGEVSKGVQALQNTLAADQAKYQKALASCSRHSEKAREAFRRVEEHSNRVGQVGTRLGDRLQRADGLRSRAQELIRLLDYLALFVVLPGGDLAFTEGLPGLFWEDKKLVEAATIAHKLRALTSEVANAGERNRLAGAAAAAEDAAAAAAGSGNAAAAAAPGGSGSSGGGGAAAAATAAERPEMEPAVGSLEYGIRRLGQYCVWLENRVVGRFDQAVEDDNLRVMGECARIMAAFDREKAIIQARSLRTSLCRYVLMFNMCLGLWRSGPRYISLLPVFQSSVDELTWVREPAVAADDAVVSERLRPLSRLYGTLGDTVAVEAGRMSSIFPDARTALQMLVAKVFGDRVIMALERLLEDTSEDAFSSSTSYSSGRPLDELDDVNEEYGSDAGSGRFSRRRRRRRRRGGRSGRGVLDLRMRHDRQSGDGGGGGRASGGAGGVGRRRHSDGGDSAGPSVLALHLYLRLLAASYVRTRELAEQVDSATSGQVDVSGLVGGVFQQFLKLYPAPELQWLDLMAEKDLAPDFDSGDPLHRPALTLAIAEGLIRRNAEAVQRCALMCPAAQVPSSVRLLYVGEAPYDGRMPGCLMEHLPGYLIAGVEREMELTLQLDGRGDMEAANLYRRPPQLQLQQHVVRQQGPPVAAAPPLPPPPPPRPPVTRAAAAQAAQAYVAVRVAPVLCAVQYSSQVVKRLQEYHVKVILPPLESSAPEVSACATGLTLGVRAVEGAVLSVMHALVDMVVIQAEKVLMYEQRRSEFLPPGDHLDAVLLDRPTDACLLVCALFEALGKVARDSLYGSNLSSFLLDVGLRMHATFLNHMQQYVYNAAGALRWRNDVAAYCDVFRSWGLPLLDSRLGAVGGLVGILVVEPDQLLPLINGTLRLDHREAIKYVRLRQDFHTARVQGRALQQIFGSEDAVPGQPAVAATAIGPGGGGTATAAVAGGGSRR